MTGPETLRTPPLAMGTDTRLGKVQAVLLTGGERYYMLLDEDNGVALMPADVVEALTLSKLAKEER